jgi:hypothetical protein
LLSPENWGKWQKALIHLVDNLEEQIENLKADSEADEQRYRALGRDGAELAKETAKVYQRKITKVERFKFHVSRRLDEVTSMMETGTVMESDGWSEVSFLKRAISTHRHMLHEYDLEDTAIDRALWDALNNQWTFDKINPNNI